MSTFKPTPLCCISGCSNSVKGQVQSNAFYYVPKDPARAKKWTEVIKHHLRPGVPLLQALTCGKHFEQHDFVDFDTNSYKLKPTALPSIFEEEESINPAKKLKIGTPTTPGQSTQYIPLDTVVLNSPDTRVFVLEASMFTNHATKREPKKTQSQLTPQNKKKDTIRPIAKKDTCIDLVEAERLKQQILLAKAKKKELKEEYNNIVKEEKKLLKEISGIDQELTEHKLQKFSQEELELLRKCFSPSQIRHLQGNKKANWTLDDLAMGYNITCMTSTNFYRYLREEMKFPLPGVSNLTKCTEDFTAASEKED